MKTKTSRIIDKYGCTVLLVDNGFSRYVWYQKPNGYIYKYTAYGELITKTDTIRYKR